MSALVTNGRNRIAYNVVRSLGRKGVAVYAADFVPLSMSFASRYTSGHFVYPSPFRQPEAFIQSLLEGLERFKAEVLIPVFEETFLVSKHKERLAKVAAFAVPDYSQILLAHNKDRWERIASSLGIPVPRTYSIHELRRDRAACREFRYPVLIKPKQGGGAWGIQEFRSADALERAIAGPTWVGKPWNEFFIQEKIVGHTHCVAMLFSHGHRRAIVGYRQLRDYPATGGQATVRVSMRNERAEANFHTLLESLRWHGVCQADFVVEEKSGTPFLIDLNPRLWGSLAQAIASGVDFPYLLYRLAKEGDVPSVPSFREDVVTRWIGGDLVALPSRLRASKHKLAILKDFVLPRKRATLLDDFSLADPLPFLTWNLDALVRSVRFRSLGAVSHDALDGVWE